jgi:hypothetical protein
MSIAQLSNRSLKKRVQLELFENEVDEIDRLSVVCGVRTRADLFNSAIALLKWSVREIESGNEIASINRNSDNFTVMHMPIFDKVRENSAEFGGDSQASRKHGSG